MNSGKDFFYHSHFLRRLYAVFSQIFVPHLPMNCTCRGSASLGHFSQYPNRLEREAMILSSFAGMLLVRLIIRVINLLQFHLVFNHVSPLSYHFQNNLPLEDILSLYNCKPSASYPHNDAKVCDIYCSVYVT